MIFYYFLLTAVLADTFLAAAFLAGAATRISGVSSNGSVGLLAGTRISGVSSKGVTDEPPSFVSRVTSLENKAIMFSFYIAMLILR